MRKRGQRPLGILSIFFFLLLTQTDIEYRITTSSISNSHSTFHILFETKKSTDFSTNKRCISTTRTRTFVF